jgi:hypothetical protein
MAMARMAEYSDHISPAPDEPHPDTNPDVHDHPVRVSGDIDRNAREDTELARLRRNYSRASSYRPQGSSTASKKPATVLERLVYVVSSFWRHQISIKVEHSTCRDHLGKSYPSICPASTLQIKSSFLSA